MKLFNSLILLFLFINLIYCFTPNNKWKRNFNINNGEKPEMVENQLKHMKLVMKQNDFIHGGHGLKNQSSSIIIPNDSIQRTNNIQLLENNKVIDFFLEQVRDYFNEVGFDPIAFQKFVKEICNALYICRIPILGDAANLSVDIVTILLEAQCYRDRIESLAHAAGAGLLPTMTS